MTVVKGQEEPSERINVASENADNLDAEPTLDKINCEFLFFLKKPT